MKNVATEENELEEWWFAAVYWLFVVVMILMAVGVMILLFLKLAEWRTLLLSLPKDGLIIDRGMALWAPILAGILLVPLAGMVAETMLKLGIKSRNFQRWMINKSVAITMAVRGGEQQKIEIALSKNEYKKLAADMHEKIETAAKKIASVMIILGVVLYSGALTSYVRIDNQGVWVRQPWHLKEDRVQIDPEQAWLETSWEVGRNNRGYYQTMMLHTTDKKFKYLILWDLNRSQSEDTLAVIQEELDKWGVRGSWQPLTVEASGESWKIYHAVEAKQQEQSLPKHYLGIDGFELSWPADREMTKVDTGDYAWKMVKSEGEPALWIQVLPKSGEDKEINDKIAATLKLTIDTKKERSISWMERTIEVTSYENSNITSMIVPLTTVKLVVIAPDDDTWFEMQMLPRIINLGIGMTSETWPTPSPSPSIQAIYRYGVWHEPGTAGYEYEIGFDAWSQRKDYQTAAMHYEKALSLDPNYAPAVTSLGYIKGEFMGQFAEGEAMLKRAMELDPNWAYAPFNLAILYNLHGRPAEAKQWMEYTLNKFADHPDIAHFQNMYSVMKQEWNDQ